MPTAAEPPDYARTAVDIEVAVDHTIRACDGDARAAVRALIVAIGLHEDMIETLQRELAEATAALSQGFTRGRFHRDRRGEGG